MKVYAVDCTGEPRVYFATKRAAIQQARASAREGDAVEVIEVTVVTIVKAEIVRLLNRPDSRLTRLPGLGGYVEAERVVATFQNNGGRS